MRTRSPKPEVSVILPTFNRSHLIMRAIQSVTMQTLRAFELIVVDDGSTDGSAETIKPLSQRDSRITYIYQPNQGLAAARNNGVSRASGKYVTYLDSDDEYEPVHLELRRDLLESDSGVMMLHGGLAIVNGSPMVPDYYDPSRLIDISLCAVGATFFYRKEFHSLVGGFHHREFGEDTEFFERAIRIGNVQRVHWPTYKYYRDSEDSIVNRVIDERQNYHE